MPEYKNPNQPNLFNWAKHQKFNQYMRDKYVYDKGYAIIDYRHYRTENEHKQDDNMYNKIMKGAV